MAKPIEIYVLQTVYQMAKAILDANGIEGFDLQWEYPYEELTPPVIVISSLHPEDNGHLGLGERAMRRDYDVVVRICAENPIREMMTRETLEQAFADSDWFNIQKWDDFPPVSAGLGTNVNGAFITIEHSEKEYDPKNPILALRYTGYIVLTVHTSRLDNDSW